MNSGTRGVTLDTGALLALERGDAFMRGILKRALEKGMSIHVPAGVIAQTWRGGPRQARIARLLADPLVTVDVLDDLTARAVGVLCARSGHHDVVDVHVALSAREHGHAVVTSDPGDIGLVDASLRIIAV